MLKNLIGKSIDEIIKYVNNFENMVEEQGYDEDGLKEGIAFSEIYKQANRKTCVILPYLGIKKALNQYKQDNDLYAKNN